MGVIKIEYLDGSYKISFKQGKHYSTKYKIHLNDFSEVGSSCIDVIRHSISEMSNIGILNLKIRYKWSQKGYTYKFSDYRISFCESNKNDFK